MSHRDRDFERGRRGMDWGEGSGYGGQFSRQDRLEGQGRFGGWNDEEQYAYDEPRFRGQERYGQGGYGQDYGRQATDWEDESPGFGSQPYGYGRGDWDQGRMGGRGYRGGREFGGGGSLGSYGGQGYGQRGFQGAGGWQPNAPQGWGNQGRARGGSWDQDQGWEQGPSGRGHWGQGYSDEGMTGQGQSRQRFGAEGYGGQGRSGGGGGTFYYEEVWLIPGPHSGRGPRGYQRNDQRIEEDVCERLTQHGQIDAEDVQVQVKNGEVTLTGTVESRQAKRMAEDLLDSISGVKDVHNQLRVQQGKREGHSDQDQHQNRDQDQVIGQTRMGNGQGGSGASRGQGQSRNQTRDAETAGVGASAS